MEWKKRSWSEGREDLQSPEKFREMLSHLLSNHRCRIAEAFPIQLRSIMEHQLGWEAIGTCPE